MKVFRRSLPPLPHLGGSIRRGHVSEDRECLLESRESKEEQEAAYDYGNDLGLEQEDYLRMAAAWESRCVELEAIIKQMKMYSYQMPQMSLATPNGPRQEREHNEMQSAMKMMKQYVLKLENENEILSESLAERDQTETRSGVGSAGSSPSAAEGKTPNKPDWKVVSIMATKLVEAKKEISELTYANACKDRDMESLISQFEEMQYENERLTTKCMSLEQAASSLVKEVFETTKVTSGEKTQSRLVKTRGATTSLDVEIDWLPEDATIHGSQELGQESSVHENEADDTIHDDNSQIVLGETTVESQDDASSCDQNEHIKTSARVSFEEIPESRANLSMEEDVIVETVRGDSDDDDISEGQPKDLETEGKDPVGSQDGSSSDDVSDGERRDGLGPLPSNPFETLRHDSLVNNELEPSTSTTSEMQQYSRDAAVFHHENAEAREATMSAIQERRANQEPEVRVDGDTSQKPHDVRLDILQNVSKHGKWHNKLLCRLGVKRNETSEKPKKGKRKAKGAETEHGVFC